MVYFLAGSTFVKYSWSLDVTVILLCLRPYWTSVIPGLQRARFKILLKNLLVIRKIPSCSPDGGFPVVGREDGPRSGLWLSFYGQLSGCGGANNVKTCSFGAKRSHMCACTYHVWLHTQVSAQHMEVLLILCWVIKPPAACVQHNVCAGHCSTAESPGALMTTCP